MFSVLMRALLIAALLLVPLISNAQVTRTTGFDAGRLSTLTRWVESRINDKRIPGAVMASRRTTRLCTRRHWANVIQRPQILCGPMQSSGCTR
jgi:hypothetical protein